MIDYLPMSKFANGQHARLLLAVTSMSLTALGWLWLMASFTAASQTWWNSNWLFLFTFGMSLVLAVAGLFVRGTVVAFGIAIAALTWSGLSVLFMLLAVTQG